MAAPNWKPAKGTHKRLKAKRKREWLVARKATRSTVYEAGKAKCVDCGRWLYLNLSEEGADWFNVANINEIIPRSLGGSAIDPANCNIKCAGCHTGKGSHRK